MIHLPCSEEPLDVRLASKFCMTLSRAFIKDEIDAQLHTFSVPLADWEHAESCHLDLKDTQQGGLVGRQRVTSSADCDV